MTDSAWQATSSSYTCVAFTYMRNVSQLPYDDVCSAILLDSSYQHLVNGVLIWSGQNTVNLPTSRSSLSDVINGRTAFTDETAVEASSNCTFSRCSTDFTVQFVTPMRTFLLKTDTHLAGCIAKTLSQSSNFAHSFVNYARHCAWKRAVIPLNSVHFIPSVADSCMDIHNPLGMLPHMTSSEETVQNVAVVNQSVVILMTYPRRVWIDYHWYVWSVGWIIDHYVLSFNDRCIIK